MCKKNKKTNKSDCEGHLSLLDTRLLQWTRSNGLHLEKCKTLFFAQSRDSQVWSTGKCWSKNCHCSAYIA